MSGARRTRLVDCNPMWSRRWTPDGEPEAPVGGVLFDCPEGHAGCRQYVPFTPALDGSEHASPQSNGAIWQRIGETFETLTLTPSIRRNPVFESREAAIASGATPEHITPTLLCAFHGFITNGEISFCGDSR